MGIVNLLPMDVLVDANPYHGIALVLALLVSAIIWNFGTWYYGIPSSSSHTLIGAILGIGIAFYFLPGEVGGTAVNWDKAKDTGLALLLSPLIGFSLAIIMMFIFKRFIKNEIIYKEPIPGKKPPIWIRMLLWLTCGTVSFFHGQNDGQKGVGLIMMILIAILPGYFAVDKSINLQSIHGNMDKIELLMKKADTTALAAKRLGRNYIGLELDKEYVRISENKLTMENPDSKIGDTWVSFYLDGIVTIRDLDWEKLAQNYIIPEPIAHIDHTPIKSKNGKSNNGYTPKKNGEIY